MNRVIPGPNQAELNLERLDLRSVIMNLVEHQTWPAASLQARLWERLAHSGRKPSASAGWTISPGHGSPLDHQSILMNQFPAGNSIAILDSRLRGNDGTTKQSAEVHARLQFNSALCASD
jgi:hypothetical protein